VSRLAQSVRPERPENRRSIAERDNVHVVQTGSGTHPDSCPVVTGGYFPRRQSGQSVMLTTYLHLLPNLEKGTYTSTRTPRLIVGCSSFIYVWNAYILNSMPVDSYCILVDYNTVQSGTVKMEAVYSLETSVSTQQRSWNHNASP
jgi:hypothetical protein